MNTRSLTSLKMEGTNHELTNEKVPEKWEHRTDKNCIVFGDLRVKKQELLELASILHRNGHQTFYPLKSSFFLSSWKFIHFTYSQPWFELIFFNKTPKLLGYKVVIVWSAFQAFWRGLVYRQIKARDLTAGLGRTSSSYRLGRHHMKEKK